MTQHTQIFLDRISLYLARVERDIDQGDYVQALADCAELAEVSRRFWSHIAALAKAERPR